MINTVCQACSGDGYTPQPLFSVVDNEPHTAVRPRPCRWCGKTGTRRGIRPRD
ncbi:hypothetical protein [Saccharomonospora sp. CUA-673]|uniref:hypothetical protein n=1 Tax=Saccharomonospora sp. CUA-673 TaxID=1904969 RepID=UPI00165112DF|nr:hypothetical protein [Saccharomonospora sp. CUA-673]